MIYLGRHCIYMGEIRLCNSLILNNDVNSREIYEVLRIEDGIVLFKNNHLKRLNSSFTKLNITPPFTEDQIIVSINKLIDIEEIKNENIKITCFIDSNNHCGYYIFIIPSFYPNSLMYAQGISTVLLDAERNNPNIKIANTKVRGTANSEIKKQHVFEALLVNHEGFITEGSRTNAFFIIGDTIYTAPSELVLEGIIRSKVIEVIQEAGYKFKMECIHTSQITQIESAFITGTSSRILPINQIKNHPLKVNQVILNGLIKLLSEKIISYKNKNAGTK